VLDDGGAAPDSKPLTDGAHIEDGIESGRRMGMRRSMLIGLLALVAACTPDTSAESASSTTTTRADTTTSSAARPMVDLTQRPLVWLTPQPYISIRDFEGGSVDFFDTFASGAEWDTAAGRVHVFKLYDQLGLVDNPPTDDQWRQAIQGIEDRGMALAMELGPLPLSKGCGGGEGFGGSYSLDLVRKVQFLGGRVDIVTLQSPYGHGHFFDELESACNWTLETVAAETAEFTRKLKELEPGVVVGGLEPLWVGLTLSDYIDWFDAYEAAAGERLAFFHLDVDWNRHDWGEVARQIESEARARGIAFGVIYNGGVQAQSDEEWTQAAADRAYLYEQVLGGRPDHVVFQSWHVYPSRVLPDTDPATLTGLVNRYFGERSGITAQAVAGEGGLQLNGSLTTVQGRPIAGEQVQIEAAPLDGTAQTLVHEGTVPDGVETAEVGIRINTEGAGPGNADIRIYEVGYFEDGEDVNRVDDPSFSGLAQFDIKGVSVIPSDLGAGTMLRLTATPEDVINLGSLPFPVRPGAPYRLTVTASVPEPSALAGYATVVFLRGDERARHILRLAPSAMLLAELTTGPDGSFELSQESPSGRYRLRVGYGGDLDHWPAYLEQVLPGE
jgi:hypothetical protein